MHELTGPNRRRSSGLAEILRAAEAARPKAVPGSLLHLVRVAQDDVSTLVRDGDIPRSPNPPDLGRIRPRKPQWPSCGASNTATESQVRENEGGIAVDWLTVHQVHGEAPVLGESLLLFVDIEDGTVVSQAVRGAAIRGSFDTSLQVRCDGRRVEVSGNPSRWGRQDNVFGFDSLDGCIELYNRVLVALGLPEFDSRHRDQAMDRQVQRSDTGMVAQGAVITRVDLCRNWAAGSSAHARLVVGALGSVIRQGKPGTVSADGNTVDWGRGSRYSYLKYYIKAAEMRRHCKKPSEYQAQLVDWCDSVGIVRQELSVKSMMLKRQGLDSPVNWSKARMEQLLDEYSPHRECGAQVSAHSELFQLLVEAGTSISRARAAQAALQAYLNGMRFIVGENISKSAYYRLRADIKLAGVDIGAPLNVATLPVRIRELVLEPAAPPQFYRWAG